MSEPVADPTRVARAVSVDAAAEQAIAQTTLGGRAVRIDPPHIPAATRNSQWLLEAVEQLAHLEEREAAVQQAFEQLETQRLAWRQQQASQRAEMQRAEFQLQEQQSILSARQKELVVQAEALVAAEHQLTAEREQLRSTLGKELDAERAALTEERERLAAEEQQIRGRVDLQLQTERQALWQELTSEWEERREAFDAERAIWDAQASVLRQQLEEQIAVYEGLVAGWEQERSRHRAELAQELHDRRAQADEEWADGQSARQQAFAEQQAELQRERVLLENRLRFQQEHLDKVRLDLDRAQNDFRAERQRERQQIEDDSRQLERRARQLNVYRQTLDELVRAVEREHNTVLQCREAWSLTVDGDRQELDGDRRLWEQERLRQQTELQRQQELLQHQGERLEGKRLRLERLRAELEDTHRTTLELRLAIEETWAQIAHALDGDEQARVQVDQARQALVLYYQQLHAALDDHRRELTEQQTWFDQQRSEFHEERQAVLHWLNERDEKLRAEDARLIAAAAEIDAHDLAWRAARDRWLAEKLEAERVIRRLISQLADDTLGIEVGRLVTEKPSTSRAA